MKVKKILTEPDYWLEMSLPLWAATHAKEPQDIPLDEFKLRGMFGIYDDFDWSCQANGGCKAERWNEDIVFCSHCGKTLEE